MAKNIVRQSGIYAIRNTANGKMYVGSSVDIHTRFRTHRSRLRLNKHHSIRLQCAWSKYGEDTFVFEVLELVPDTDQLIVAEQRWLDRYQSFSKRGYNICHTAGSSRGIKQSPELIEKRIAPLRGRKQPPESVLRSASARRGQYRAPSTDATRQKQATSMRAYWGNLSDEDRETISASKKRGSTQESRRKQSEANLGKRTSDETKLRISAANSGKKRTLEQRERMSEAQRAIRKRKLEQGA